MFHRSIRSSVLKKVSVAVQRLERRCLLAAVSWDGGAGTSEWTDAANWSGDALPTPADDVTIDVLESITVSITSGTHSVNSLNCAEDLTVNGAELSVADTSNIDGTFRLRGNGILGGDGDVLLNGTMFWSNGSMTGTGTTRIGASGTLAFATESSDSINPKLFRNLVNDGTVALSVFIPALGWHARIKFDLHDCQFINNGIINAGDRGEVRGSGSLVNNGSIINNNALAKFSFFAPLVNNGSLSVTNGQFEFSASVQQNGTLTASAPGSVNFKASTTFGPSSITTGTGAYTFSGGTHVLDPARYTSNGTTAFSGANVTVNTPIAQLAFPVQGSGDFNIPLTLNNAQIFGAFAFNQPVTFTGTTRLGSGVVFNSTVTRSFANLQILGGTVTFPGTSPLSVDALTISGTLNTPAPITVNSTATITSGGLAGAGEPLTIPSSATFTVSSGAASVAKDIVNNGTIAMAGGSLNFSGATLTNHSTIRFTGSSGSMNPTANLNLLINNGQIIRSAAGTGGINIPLTNDGSILVDAGTFVAAALTNNATVSVAAGAVLSLRSAIYNPGSSVTGAGDVAFGIGGINTIEAATFNTTGDLRFQGGVVTLNLPRTLAGNRTILGQVTFNQPVTFGGAVTISATCQFNSSVAFEGTLTIVGGVTSITTIASSATFGGVVAVSGRLNVDTPSPGITIPNLAVTTVLGGSGELTVTGSLNLTGSMVGTGTTRLGPTANLSIGHAFLDRTLALAPNLPTVVWTFFPSIEANGRLDLANNTLIIDHQNTVSSLGVESLVRRARAGGTWTGTGITSSAIASQPGTGIGVADSTTLFSSFPSTFAGVPVDSTAIVVRFTVEGDLNLDRTVNFDDLLILAQNYGQIGRTFSQGNINYSADRKVDFDDLLLLAQRYGSSLITERATTAKSGRRSRIEDVL